MTVNAHQTEAEVDINKKRQAEEDSKTALKLKMADNELRQVTRGRDSDRSRETRGGGARAALIQRAVEEQKVMKERTQQQVEEAKVLLQVAEQQALTAQKEAEVRL